MKFAKELERDLVPEWRIKYLDYKAGKKYIKAVSRAISRSSAGTTPLSFVRQSDTAASQRTPSFGHSPFATAAARRPTGARDGRDLQRRGTATREELSPLRSSPAPMGTTPVLSPHSQAAAASARTPPIPTGADDVGEREGLARSGADLQYGSIVQTPHRDPLLTDGASGDARDWALPAPAISAEPTPMTATKTGPRSRVAAMQRSASMAPSIPGGTPQPEQQGSSLFRLPQPALGSTGGSGTAALRPGKVQRIFSMASPGIYLGFEGRRGTDNSLPMQSFDLVRERQREFFEFLDSELAKIEDFYREKEKLAAKTLERLRNQLHEMRNQRTQELDEAKRRKERDEVAQGGEDSNDSGDGGNPSAATATGRKVVRWMEPIKHRILKPGPNSKALQNMARTPVMNGILGNGANSAAARNDARRDYIRRPHDAAVSYRTAKYKLKLALQEFYRSLELLKSYALLNRTAFRKLNKKYDKAVNARPPYRYVNEKVTNAWFVKSTVLDEYITAVEDLYAKYFEGGNHKVAAGKLRSLGKRPGDESVSSFWNGAFLTAGIISAIQGLINGVPRLWSEDDTARQQASYLMQIYAGYFFMVYLFGLFCACCYVWNRNKVNYPFIFEFEPRHHLDWRQLSEFPSFCFALLGFFLWLNFSVPGSSTMYLYYPVLLIFLTSVLILLPAPTLAHKSRKWFVATHGRLLLAPWFGVEFRDFFLGDIYCSLTYATSNIGLFFCLHARFWHDPDQCNSSHSRWLGFLSALPPVLRFLQCLRRYHDTGQIYPHLANGGKYTMSILAAVTLSLYRIDGTTTNLAVFVLFSAINAIYCSAWDIFTDMSLLQNNRRNFLIREVIALKQRWPYYVVMVVDPILRFSWIFYAIFTHDRQHSTLASFCISLAEVTRRGLWMLFRVENEHCGNVAAYKASRDVELPYHLETLESESSEASPLMEGNLATAVATGALPAQMGRADLEGGGNLRRRRASTVGTPSIRQIIAEAHRQDFEKRRRPEEADPDEEHSDEEEDEEEEDLMEADDLAQRGQAN